MFFQVLLAIKIRLVDKMMQSTYLCVILHVKSAFPVKIKHIAAKVENSISFIF